MYRQSRRERASPKIAVQTMSPAELKAIRKSLGLSTTAFGRALGYTGETDTVRRIVRRLETGKAEAPAAIAAAAEQLTLERLTQPAPGRAQARSR